MPRNAGLKFKITLWVACCITVTNQYDNTTWSGSGNDILLPNVRVSEIPKPVGKEKGRKVAVPLNGPGYVRSTSSTTKRIIYLATNYFKIKHTNKNFYFLTEGKESFYRYGCPVKDCFVTKREKDINRAHAILFHVRDVTVLELAWAMGRKRERNPNQKWILYTMEPPWLELLDLNRLDYVFNWTMSYRMDSDFNVKYGFVGRRTSFNRQLIPNFRKKKKLAVWLATDCCTLSRREKFIEEMKKHVTVDAFGGCGQSFCSPAEDPKCYKRIQNYYFYLSFENSLCKDYVTEKLFNILDSDLVPVVLGGARYENLLPRNSYINALDFATPKELSKYLEKVSRNQTLYESFFQWKMHGQSYMYAWTCDLCAKLHSPHFTTKSVKTNLNKWWSEEANCKRWSPFGLYEATYPIIPCYDTKEFRNG